MIFAYHRYDLSGGNLTFLLRETEMKQVEDGYPLEAGSGERRSSTRTTTVFRPVLIETAEFSGFCLIRNLSETGIMGHVYTNFAENQSVTIHFGQTTRVEGTLVWCMDGRVGVRFDHTIDVDGVLAQLAAKSVNGRLNRPPRLQLRCEGKLIIGDRALTIEVQDVSQRGIKVLASFIRTGDELYVEMSGLERRKAIVRWTQAGVAGLHFVTPLSFEQLANWAVAQQTRKPFELPAMQVS